MLISCLTPHFLLLTLTHDHREGAQPVIDAWEWQHAVITFASKVLPNRKEMLGAVLPTLRAFVETEGEKGFDLLRTTIG